MQILRVCDSLPIKTRNTVDQADAQSVLDKIIESEEDVRTSERKVTLPERALHISDLGSLF